MNNQRPMFINIFSGPFIFSCRFTLLVPLSVSWKLIVASSKILVPVAIIVWLVRTISGNMATAVVS